MGILRAASDGKSRHAHKLTERHGLSPRALNGSNAHRLHRDGITAVAEEWPFSKGTRWVFLVTLRTVYAVRGVHASQRLSKEVLDSRGLDFYQRSVRPHSLVVVPRQNSIRAQKQMHHRILTTFVGFGCGEGQVEMSLLWCGGEAMAVPRQNAIQAIIKEGPLAQRNTREDVCR